MRVERVTSMRASAIREALDPSTNFWLRSVAGSPEVGLFEAEDGGVLAILGDEARLGHPTSSRAAVALAAATANVPLARASGATTAVRAFVDSRNDGGWRSVFAGAEMLKCAPPVPRPIVGEMCRASEIAGDPALPPPFDAWMRAFIDEEFEPGVSPPPVTASQLWFWIADGSPRTMAGAIERGSDSTRIVTVYTPPALRGAGWAGALVGAMAESAGREGRRYVTLNVADTNMAARRAYERAGFRSMLSTEIWLRREL